METFDLQAIIYVVEDHLPFKNRRMIYIFCQMYE